MDRDRCARRAGDSRRASAATSRPGRTAPVQVLINGDNANTATTVMGYALTHPADRVGAQYRRRRVRRRAPPVAVEPRVWYNPELRSTLFLVPGLIAYIAMITAVVSTALSIVREKERGTMEQVRMAPIGTLLVRRRQDAAVLRHLAGLGDRASSSRRWCCSTCRCAASWLLLLVALSLFLVGALGTGPADLDASPRPAGGVPDRAARRRSCRRMMLSGFIFPICEHADARCRSITYVVPARYFLVALRGIVLKGVGTATSSGRSSSRWRSTRPSMLALASLRLRRAVGLTCGACGS